MSTVKYNEFLAAYDNGYFTDQKYFGVLLVTSDYQPLATHTLEDVEPYVIAKTSRAISWANFCTHGMSEITSEMQIKIVAYVIENQTEIFTKISVLKDAEKLETILTELISNPENLDIQELRDNGIKWLVTYFDTGKLGFCENI